MEIFFVESVDGRTDARTHGRRLDYHTISSPCGELKNWTLGAHLPPPRGIIHVYFHNIQTAWPIKAKFYVNGGINVYINNLGHMTKMAAMPIYGKNPSKIFFSGAGGLISKKLGMKHRWLMYYNVYINNDPVITLTYFTTRST